MTPAPGGAYKVLIAAQHKLSKSSFAADFEVHRVTDIVLVDIVESLICRLLSKISPLPFIS